MSLSLSSLVRLNFSQRFITYCDEFWRKAIFFSEMEFQISPAGIFIGDYRITQEGLCYDRAAKLLFKARTSLTVLGWISARGKGNCVFLQNEAAALSAQDVFEQQILPDIRLQYPEHIGLSFFMPSAEKSSHFSSELASVIQLHYLPVFFLPPHSDDFHPMTCVWLELGRLMVSQRSNPFPTTLNMLVNDIAEMWEYLPTEPFFTRLADQFPIDLAKVIDADGGRL